MDSSDAQDLSSADPPPFDPLVPGPPVSFPIKTLEDLLSQSYFKSFHYPFNKATVPLKASSLSLPDRQRILACHDMEGGYLDDKWVQGGNSEDAYAIWHWYLIDVFVYFSHNLVTLPPPCWTNAAHKNGVKMLGTFITESDEGKEICDKLLSSKESARMYADRLVELAVSLGFDGWLLNIEVNLELGQIIFLKEFISHLTQALHSAIPGSLVIWYDAVTIHGELDWQNQLTENNRPFFDISDGIFVNYQWTEEYTKQSAAVADVRKFDVYMGIDVFGRGTYGDGKWNTNIALDVLKKAHVSAAIFAPGWVYETKQPPNFETAQNRWWFLVEESWGIQPKSPPRALPFYSNFDQFSRPVLKYPSGATRDTITVLTNFKEPFDKGGGNLIFKGTLGSGTSFTARLFQGELQGVDLPVHCIYAVKTRDSSLLGLVFELSSTSEGRQSVLLAFPESQLLTMQQFAHKFDKVIMSQRSVKPGLASPGWMMVESSLSLKGHTLTSIHAVCYKLQPETAPSPAEYDAELGHLAIRLSSRDFEFPSSSSWVVQARRVEWGSSSQGSKQVSVEITWKLEDGDYSSFMQYNIYVQKLSEPEFAGVAHVEAFYVSGLVVPPGVSTLKFTVQVCCVDGSVQKLDDSPSFHLQVEG